MVGKRWLERRICVRLKLKNLKYMEFLKELFQFIKTRKKWWLAPVIVILLLLGILLVVGGGSAIAPFIYTLF
jgi:hypothetical protein